MKFKRIIFTFLALATIFLFSCNSENNENNNINIENDTLTTLQKEPYIKNGETKNDTIVIVKDEKEIKKTKTVFKYICPLGDKEGNSDKAGICPICEMELIENPDYTK